MVVVTVASCPNPKCTCSPCLCGEECKCGGGSKLGDLERQVMDVVWAAGNREVTAREVADALPVYAYTTVATVLNRLSRKGELRRRLDCRTNRFAAIETPTDRAASAMLEALGSGDDRRAVLERFARTMSSGDAAILRRALKSSS